MPLRVMFQLFGELRRRMSNQSGQAMVEYSTITFFILLGGVAGGMTINFPDQNAPILIAFLNGLKIYMTSLYSWIDLPLG